MKCKKKIKGFTLIELLVVISILGILMGIVGPKVIDLLSGSEKTKTQAIIRGWVTQLHQYKSHYGYFPPFLLTGVEGVPVSLADSKNYNDFIVSLKGKSLVNGRWEPLEAGNTEIRKQNRKAKEFHSFSEDEFYIVPTEKQLSFVGDFPHLIGTALDSKLYILVDQDGDGAIDLDTSLLNDIKQSLSIDFSSSQIQKISDEVLGRIHEKVVILLIKDDLLDVQNVYSWNIEKYFE